MDLRVIGVLLLVPLLDVMLLVVLATRLGPAVTVALVVLTAFIGLLLVRAEGRHTLGRLQAKVAEGTPPTDELLDGALLLVAGALMLTPGLVTDLVGLLFVLPPTRYPIRVALKKYVVTPYVNAKTDGFATGNIYMGGFPNEDEGSGPRSEEFFKQGDGGAVDMDDDEYEFTDPDADAESDDGFTDVRFEEDVDDDSDTEDPREP